MLLCYYQGQKKLKQPDRSGRGGHIGCSDGYNYNLYKPFLPYKQPNSQVSPCTKYLSCFWQFYTFTGERADACQVGQVVSQLDANGLLRLYAVPQSVLWINKLGEQRYNLKWKWARPCMTMITCKLLWWTICDVHCIVFCCNSVIFFVILYVTIDIFNLVLIKWNLLYNFVLAVLCSNCTCSNCSSSLSCPPPK